ncbi:nitroreductase [Halieaceae bacterium IMCC14734]|uniref:Nitroreductase n=1 Tax=Candidatus Litorirhabdus singularis TaxID=2518993 RepID=A0ABT3THH1_9GAMM|nr:nitroreductase [Candidatus Litorirhabdus singularis]MCX2981726.1 nitroreductase [Candidatus Litorirhabdus singularis]
MTELAKEFSQVVAARKSVRAFKPEPLSEQLLAQIFSAALRAPSNCNTQPWQVHVASGERLEVLRERMPADFMAGKMTIDFPYDGVYEGVYKERQYGSAQALYDSMGIKREEKQKRQASFMRNFTFFDAPHVAFLFLPAPLGLREACDLGMYAQTLMLSMVAHGAACCPQTALSFQCDLVREVLEVDASNKLLFGISFGYEVEEAPVNSCHTDRGGLADIVHFHS